MIPTRVGRNPRKNPYIPSFSSIFLAIADGCPAAEESSPTAAEEDWSCIFTTSRGLVMQEAMVPATPPDRRFKSFILEAVMEGVATKVEPPRVFVEEVEEMVLLPPPPPPRMMLVLVPSRELPRHFVLVVPGARPTGTIYRAHDEAIKTTRKSNAV